MKKNTRVLFSIFLLFLPLLLSGQEEKVHLDAIYRIKQEGFRNSQVRELSFWMTDYLGPRLSGSSGLFRANEWSREKMIELGLKNVRIEPWGEFGRGWDNHKTYVAMTSPYYSNLIATPMAWTPGTQGMIRSEAVLLDVSDTSELSGYTGMLAGKIVITPLTGEYEVSFEPLARRMTDEDLAARSRYGASGRDRYRGFNVDQYRREAELRAAINSFLTREDAAAILENGGFFGTVRSSGASLRSPSEAVLPELTLSGEHYGRIVRLLQHNIPVEIEMEIGNSFQEKDLKGYNVIGEIPGTDKNLKNQVVLAGAHLDSWHGGTGANDNASGCVVMMEAMRILNAIGFTPRRTVRIALWGAEEQGLRGSRGYVRDYLGDPLTMELKPGYHNFCLYLNVDNGSGKIRGIHLQENDLIRPVFESWLKPFADMGANTITLRNTGGSDHQSFDALGLPGFQFIQDPIDYGRGYHTNMDTYERLMFEDMMHNAVIVASLVYHAAMRDELLPRKPLPE